MALLPWAMSVSVLVAGNTEIIKSSLLLLVFYVSIYGIVAIQNDLSDYQIDVLNKRGLPFASKLISRNELRNVTIWLSCVLFLVICLLGWVAAITATLYIILGWLYSGSPKLKNKHWPAIAILSVCYGLLPWVFGFLLAGNSANSAQLLVIASSVVFVAGIIPLKDFKDLAGDKKFNKNTLLVVKGEKYVRYNFKICVVAAFTLLTFATSMLGIALLSLLAVVQIYVSYLVLCVKSLNSKEIRLRLGRFLRPAYYVSACSLMIISATL